MYKVLWSDSALEDIVQFWANADPEVQRAITAAMHQIDLRLANDPENVGESRIGAERIWFEFPLGVLFEIDSGKKAVHLLEVWIYRKRR